MKYAIRKIINKLSKMYDIKLVCNIDITKKRKLQDYLENERNIRQTLPKNIWPKDKKAAFVLEFDDFCTKTKKHGEYDYGGDPDSGIKPGTKFKELPDNWLCPNCGADKTMFEEVKD